MSLSVGCGLLRKEMAEQSESGSVGSMKSYLRVLSALYFVGSFLHWADIFDLRLHLSSMSLAWKIWIFYLCFFDLLAAIGLWRGKLWGQALFIIIAGSQLIAYTLFTKIFGRQTELIVFHIVCFAIYFSLLILDIRRSDRIAA